MAESIEQELGLNAQILGQNKKNEAKKKILKREHFFKIKEHPLMETNESNENK